MNHNYFQQYISAVTNPLPAMADYFNKENDYFKKLVRSDSAVLDVGCGNGRSMKFLAPLVNKIVGIDCDEEMLGAAKKLLFGVPNTQLIIGDFMEMDFEKEFDLTFASYNLLGSCEIPPNHRKPMIEKMVRVTKPGGHVVASVWSDLGIEFARHYYPSIGIQVFDIQNNTVMTDHGFFKRFTKEELIDLVKDTGYPFNVIELTPIFYLLDIQI